VEAVELGAADVGGADVGGAEVADADACGADVTGELVVDVLLQAQSMASAASNPANVTVRITTACPLDHLK
jgi:hypothetical protein